MAFFEEAAPQQKRDKIFIYGPPGTYKTRTMLRLASGSKNEPAALAIIDHEFGSDHYAGEFKFNRLHTVDPDETMKAVQELAKNPGAIRTLGQDTFSVYYESLISKYADLFLKRELRSVGHKQEYYTLQPRDYQPINREASKFVRLLLKSDLNVIVLCQQKDVWGDGMKIEGTTFDGWKRLAYYFDTVLEIIPGDKKKTTWKCVCHKDRSYHLKRFEVYPWGTDTDVCTWLEGAGFDLLGGPAAASFVDEEPAAAAETATATQSEAPEPEKPAIDQAVQMLADDPQPQPTGTTNCALLEAEKKALLDEVVKLKQACRINGADWPKYIKPFKVATAREMTSGQLEQLIATLTEVKNTPARTAA